MNVTQNGGGASWNLSSGNLTVTINPAAENANQVRYHLVMEMTEQFMRAQGFGWYGQSTEGSAGEGLSRFLATQFMVNNGLGNQPAGFDNSNAWLSTGRADFVNNISPTDDGPDAITGCALCFIYYLFAQLGFSRDQIVAAGASTLGGVYRNLTGDVADPFPFFKREDRAGRDEVSDSHRDGEPRARLVADRFPEGQVAPARGGRCCRRVCAERADAGMRAREPGNHRGDNCSPVDWPRRRSEAHRRDPTVMCEACPMSRSRRAPARTSRGSSRWTCRQRSSTGRNSTSSCGASRRGGCRSTYGRLRRHRGSQPPGTMRVGPAMRNWRYVVGTFQVKIPVTTSEVMLRPEENTLAIMKWRLTQLKPANRWRPVLERYISYIAARIDGLGGNAASIEPSPNGVPPEGHGKPSEHEYTGKVCEVLFDCFGDFEGFVLSDCCGTRRFKTRQHGIGELVLRACKERLRLSVYTDHRAGTRNLQACDQVLTTARLPAQNGPSTGAEWSGRHSVRPGQAAPRSASTGCTSPSCHCGTGCRS